MADMFRNNFAQLDQSARTQFAKQIFSRYISEAFKDGGQNNFNGNGNETVLRKDAGSANSHASASSNGFLTVPLNSTWKKKRKEKREPVRPSRMNMRRQSSIAKMVFERATSHGLINDAGNTSPMSASMPSSIANSPSNSEPTTPILAPDNPLTPRSLSINDQMFQQFIASGKVIELALEAITDMMQRPGTGVTVKDRSHLLRTYKDCVVMSELLEWLLTNGLANDQQEAYLLAQNLVQLGLLKLAEDQSNKEAPETTGFYVFTKKAGYKGVMSIPIPDSLDSLLRSPLHLRAFKRFLHQVNSASYLRFLEDVERFKELSENVPLEQKEETASRIYWTYFHDEQEGENTLRLSDGCKRKMRQDIENANVQVDMFSEAEMEVIQSLDWVFRPNFLSSPDLTLHILMAIKDLMNDSNGGLLHSQNDSTKQLNEFGTFTGFHLVEWMITKGIAPSKPVALEICGKLLEQGVIQVVNRGGKEKDLKEKEKESQNFNEDFSKWYKLSSPDITPSLFKLPPTIQMLLEAPTHIQLAFERFLYTRNKKDNIPVVHFLKSEHLFKTRFEDLDDIVKWNMAHELYRTYIRPDIVIVSESEKQVIDQAISRQEYTADLMSSVVDEVVVQIHEDYKEFKTMDHSEILILETIADWIRDPSDGVTVRDRSVEGVTYRQCLIGQEIVDWIVKRRIVEDRQQAEALAMELVKYKLLQPVTSHNAVSSFEDGYALFHVNVPRAKHDLLAVPDKISKLLESPIHVQALDIFLTDARALKVLDILQEIREFQSLSRLTDEHERVSAARSINDQLNQLNDSDSPVRYLSRTLSGELKGIRVPLIDPSCPLPEDLYHETEEELSTSLKTGLAAFSLSSYKNELILLALIDRMNNVHSDFPFYAACMKEHSYDSAFLASGLIDWLKSQNFISDRSEGILVGRELLRYGLIRAVDSRTQRFEDNGIPYYLKESFLSRKGFLRLGSLSLEDVLKSPIYTDAFLSFLGCENNMRYLRFFEEMEEIVPTVDHVDEKTRFDLCSDLFLSYVAPVVRPFALDAVLGEYERDKLTEEYKKRSLTIESFEGLFHEVDHLLNRDLIPQFAAWEGVTNAYLASVAKNMQCPHTGVFSNTEDEEEDLIQYDDHVDVSHKFFAGHSCVDWLMRGKIVSSRRDAVHLGKALASRGLIKSKSGIDRPFRDSADLFEFTTDYKLNYPTPQVLEDVMEHKMQARLFERFLANQNVEGLYEFVLRVKSYKASWDMLRPHERTRFAMTIDRELVRSKLQPLLPGISSPIASFVRLSSDDDFSRQSPAISAPSSPRASPVPLQHPQPVTQDVFDQILVQVMELLEKEYLPRFKQHQDKDTLLFDVLVQMLRDPQCSFRECVVRRAKFRRVCFFGRDLIDWLAMEGVIRDRQDGVKIGQALINKHIILGASNEKATKQLLFKDTVDLYFFISIPQYNQERHAGPIEPLTPPLPSTTPVPSTSFISRGRSKTPNLFAHP
eukprot:GILK01011735.1.p1 GENE.GILK01011735.1~~GILK01011735.1.p1  ORF type:complete len:1555 (+),score=312.79 GILK01011735.1:234-4667(+)